MPPSLEPELTLARELVVTQVAGLDEAGRGALAGPVFAAAVILPLESPTLQEALQGVDDSKLVRVEVRESLVPLIQQHAVAFGIGSAPAEMVDREGIIPATHQAMMNAIAQLPAQALLIDGLVRLPRTMLPQRSLVRGDTLSLSIAAASILAKVSRDAYMIELEAQFPGYGFARHKGYGTLAHRECLARLGPCPEHRRSFAPLRPTLLDDLEEIVE